MAKAGRPPKNNPNDPDALQKKIDAYFDNCIEQEKRPTYCGLALSLGYASRQQLWEHGRANEPISLPLKKGMLRIEDAYEQALTSAGCAGSIFALKNRGWTDKQEITGGDGEPIIIKVVKGAGD